MRRRHLLLGTAAACTTGPRAWAAGFPDHAVRLVVPYSVGVGPDVVARAVAARLQARWQQPVVVDNRPGGAGIVAFGDVRRTPADGHTLYLGDAATLALNPLLHDRLPYDPSRDLAPLSLLFRATFVLWTGGDGRFARITDLLDAARRQPGRISYASLGHGHPSQVAVETLAQAADVHLVHVPFKDAGALFTALAAGEVDMSPFSHHTVAGLAARGRLRALAVAARQRVASLPEVPTLAEAGAPAVEMHPWAALVTLAGTPADRLALLRHDLAEVLDAPELRDRIEQAGFELTPSSPQGVRERIDADAALLRPLLASGRLARP